MSFGIGLTRLGDKERKLTFIILIYVTEGSFLCLLENSQTMLMITFCFKHLQRNIHLATLLKVNCDVLDFVEIMFD